MSGKWDELKSLAEAGKLSEPRLSIAIPELMDLIAAAERGDPEPPKRKSVVEEIWRIMNLIQDPEFVCGPAYDPKWAEARLLRRALAEAVEHIQGVRAWADRNRVPINKKALESILAILKGEKTREIPK